MKNIHFVPRKKYSDPARYEKIADGIYKALTDSADELVLKGHYVTTLSFTLEAERNELEDRQYPLEDILDEFLAHVSEFVQDDPDNPEMILELCTQNWPEKMTALTGIVGKQVYNQQLEKNGQTLIELVII